MIEQMTDKVPDHVLEFVEKELYDYPINRETVMEYLRRRGDVLAQGRQAPDGDGRREGGPPSDPTHASAVRLLALERSAERARFYVEAIDSTMRVLNEEERRMVKRRYFDRDITNAGLAHELNMSERQFYRMRYEVVRKFAMRMTLI